MAIVDKNGTPIEEGRFYAEKAGLDTRREEISYIEKVDGEKITYRMNINCFGSHFDSLQLLRPDKIEPLSDGEIREYARRLRRKKESLGRRIDFVERWTESSLAQTTEGNPNRKCYDILPPLESRPRETV